MSNSITIRNAGADEASHLSGLALRSKAHWGYSRAFLDSCVDELTVHATQIESERSDVVVAERSGKIVGFYLLERLSDSGPDSGFELSALFVEPEHIGSGVGRGLIRHALNVVAAKSGSRLVIQGDPNAEAFYRAAGARQVGSRESGSVPGRMLPLFEIVIR